MALGKWEMVSSPTINATIASSHLPCHRLHIKYADKGGEKTNRFVWKSSNWPTGSLWILEDTEWILIVSQQYPPVFSRIFWGLAWTLKCQVPSWGRKLLRALLLSLAVLELPIWGGRGFRRAILELHVDFFLFIFSSCFSSSFTALLLLANLVDSWKVYVTFGSSLPWSKFSSASLLRHFGPGPLCRGSVLTRWGREYPVLIMKQNDDSRRDLAAVRGDASNSPLIDPRTSVCANLWKLLSVSNSSFLLYFFTFNNNIVSS